MMPEFMSHPIPQIAYVFIAVMLFALGGAGVMLRRNIVIVLISIELMLNAGNLLFATFARSYEDSTGHTAALFVITVAAAEAAVGLAIVIALFRHHRSVDTTVFSELRH